jgi:hypothetical protein
VVEGHHPVAGPEFRDARPDGGDHAGRLVAINAGRFQQVVLDLFEVGVADTAGFDAKQDLAWLNDRCRDLFDVDDAFAAINRGAHGFRYGAQTRIGNRQKIPPKPPRPGHIDGAAE